MPTHHNRRRPPDDDDDDVATHLALRSMPACFWMLHSVPTRSALDGSPVMLALRVDHLLALGTLDEGPGPHRLR